MIAHRYYHTTHLSLIRSPWPELGTPWFQHTAKGTHMRGDVWEILQQTWESQATDPRDKVFGILGYGSSMSLPIMGAIVDIFTSNTTTILPGPPILAWEHRLDRCYQKVHGIIRHSPHQLFVLEQGKGMGNLVLILRKLGTPGDYKIVVCFVVKLLFLIANGPPPEFHRSWERRDRPYRILNRKLISYNLWTIQAEAKRALYPLRSAYNHERWKFSKDDRKTFAQLFASMLPCERLALDVIQGLMNEFRGISPGFLESYKTCLKVALSDEKFKIEDDHLVFYFTLYGDELEPFKGLSFMEHCSSLASRTEIQWQWLDDNSDIAGWRNINELVVKQDMRPRGEVTYVRARIYEIRRFVEVCKCTAAISRLAGARSYFNCELNETNIYLRPSHRDDELILCHDWPQVAIDEFNMDGRMKTVRIL
ncbi:hypothetical protein QBC37DRAFT_454882 [Rhypophila decipiens]|uniref:Uncharacterized protein n=1 Tax=Rhypophila decipiens TaxID=261697 RepID=A0AAN6XXU1_9PEZI|nr:hypothetical protein QBC37DRAFT_454882 [Rhypophila decipiens]